MADSYATRFSLRITAGPGAPATARLFIAATLRVLGLDEDLIDDARLAISELVTASVARSPEGVVDVTFDADVMGLEVAPLHADDLDREAQLVVTGLFDVIDDHGNSVGVVIRPDDDT